MALCKRCQKAPRRISSSGKELTYCDACQRKEWAKQKAKQYARQNAYDDKTFERWTREKRLELIEAAHQRAKKRWWDVGDL